MIKMLCISKKREVISFMMCIGMRMDVDRAMGRLDNNEWML
jgi:hypothetical protein